ncbi:transposase, partial [Aquibacillus halophilus]|nr:transposase [Aquibacillus halophilus]
MKMAKSVRHKITNHSRIFDATLAIYNEALTFIMEVIETEFDTIDDFQAKSIVAAVEKLIHRTKSNPTPKYREFNTRFYKLPCYFRRGAIASAFGKVKSY